MDDCVPLSKKNRLRPRHHSWQIAAILAISCNSTHGLLFHTNKRSVVQRGRDDEAVNWPKTNSAIGSTVVTNPSTPSKNPIIEEDGAFYPPSSIRGILPNNTHGKNLLDRLVVDSAIAGFVPWQDEMYDQALHLKCPFLRRRAIDIVEFCHTVVRNLLDPDETYLGACPSLLCHGRSCTKRFGLSIDELLKAIRDDWKEDSNLGYYVTGRLSTDIYRDDCLFDGPDPDMPVVGLRKYIYAASQLFDQKQSWSKLSFIEIQDGSCIVAHWQFRGILRLPWKPLLPMVCGSTTYHVDPCGLIYQHVETWDLSVQEAFLRTFLPAFFPDKG